MTTCIYTIARKRCIYRCIYSKRTRVLRCNLAIIICDCILYQKLMYSPCFLSWQKILPISFQVKTFLPVRNEKQQQINNDVVSGAQTTLMHLYKAVNPHTALHQTVCSRLDLPSV